MPYTPGPWKWNKNNDRFFVCDSKGQTVSWSAFSRTNPIGESEQQDNARLIATAPDMLNSIYFALASLGRCDGNHETDDDRLGCVPCNLAEVVKLAEGR